METVSYQPVIFPVKILARPSIIWMQITNGYIFTCCICHQEHRATQCTPMWQIQDHCILCSECYYNDDYITAKLHLEYLYIRNPSDLRSLLQKQGIAITNIQCRDVYCSVCKRKRTNTRQHPAVQITSAVVGYSINVCGFCMKNCYSV